MKGLILVMLVSVCLTLHIHEDAGTKLTLAQQIDLIQQTSTVGRAQASMVQTLQPNFGATCEAGYKRGNNINVVNTMYDSIQLADTYMESGKLLKSGVGKLGGNNNITTWRFVKHSYGATGSMGSLVWNLDSYTQLVVIFLTPWSAYNLAEVCIFSQKNTAKYYYNYLYSNPSQPNNCVRLDNQKSKLDFFYRSKTLTVAPYTVSVFDKYESSIDGCYTQEIDLAIGKA